MKGNPDGSFAPDAPVTRAQFCQMLMNLKKGQNTSTQSPFSDVSAGDWFYDAVLWAHQNAYVNGYDNGFYPNEGLSRQDGVVILGRTFGFVSSHVELLQNFGDYEYIADYSKVYFAAMVEKGLVKGYDDNTLRPDQSITRAEALALLIRAQESQKGSAPFVDSVVRGDGNKGGSSSGSSGSGSSSGGDKTPAPQDKDKPTISSGTAQIKTPANLAWVLNADHNIAAINAITISADLDMSKYYFSSTKDVEEIPSGKTFVPFRGLVGLSSFNGNGHKISNFTLYLPNTDNVGLFELNNGTIENLALQNAVITGKNNVGALCGKNSGSVKNVYVNAKVTGAGNVGAVCGYGVSGAVKNVYAQGEVFASGENAGGICGYSEGQTIRQSVSRLTMVSGADFVGGICGAGKGVSDNVAFNAVVMAGGQNVKNIGGKNLGDEPLNSNQVCENQTLLAGGVLVTDSEGTSITKQQAESPEPYAGWDNAPSGGMPTFGGVTLAAQEAKPAPNLVKAEYKGAGNSEGAVVIEAQLDDMGFLLWAAAPAGTENPQLSYSEAAFIFRGAQAVELVLPSLDQNYDVYLKTRSMDQVEAQDSTKIANLEPQVFSGGDGSKENPYVIKTASQLTYVPKFASASFILGATIDLAEIDWTPIENFSGSFNGGADQGFKIVNLTSTKGGLFGQMANNSTVQNLIIENADINTANNTVGILAGMLTQSCTVENVGVVKSSVKAGMTMGGLIGRADHASTIKNCFVGDTTLGKGSDNTMVAGGICGSLSFAAAEGMNAMENCYFTGTINISGENIGGLLGGFLQDGWHIMTIRDSFALGSQITRIGSNPGGMQMGRILGTEDANMTLVNNYALSSMSMTAAPVKGADTKDGADISFAAATNINTYYDAGWNATVWGESGGEYNLPILKTLPGWRAGGLAPISEGGVNKSALEALVATAQTKVEANYTPESWQPFAEALLKAQGVLDNDAATQSQVDGAYDDLNGKMAALQTVEYVPEGYLPVTSAADLAAITGSNKYYFTKDIDLTNVAWTPIAGFSGEIDGNGKIISNLTTNGANGLFATLEDGGIIKNLIVKDASITCADAFNAVLVGNLKTGATIENCAVLNATLNGAIWGGLIAGGANNGSVIRGCVATGQGYSSAGFIGGIVGGAIQPVIENCYFNGTLTGGNEIGGIAGKFWGNNSETPVIRNCYTAGAISGDGKNHGGIVGTMTGEYGTGHGVKNCVSVMNSIQGTDPRAEFPAMF